MSANLVYANCAFMCAEVLSFHCTVCQSSVQVHGNPARLGLLLQHTEHLECAIVDLLVMDFDVARPAEIRIGLVPPAVQILALFFSLN